MYNKARKWISLLIGTSRGTTGPAYKNNIISSSLELTKLSRRTVITFSSEIWDNIRLIFKKKMLLQLPASLNQFLQSWIEVKQLQSRWDTRTEDPTDGDRGLIVDAWLAGASIPNTSHILWGNNRVDTMGYSGEQTADFQSILTSPQNYESVEVPWIVLLFCFPVLKPIIVPM